MSVRDVFPEAEAFVIGEHALDGQLDEAAEHHLRRVARVRPGDAVAVGDGRSTVQLARLSASGIELRGQPVAIDAHVYPLTVGFGLLKGDRNDLVVQKLTESGVDVIQPLQATRTVVRWSPEQRSHHVARWQAIVRSAAQQCWRPTLPTVCSIEESTSWVAGSRAGRAEAGATCLDRRFDQLLVGPEGGWTAEEFADVAPVSLGPYTLRGETAAIAAGVTLALWRMRHERNTR